MPSNVFSIDSMHMVLLTKGLSTNSHARIIMFSCKSVSRPVSGLCDTEARLIWHNVSSATFVGEILASPKTVLSRSDESFRQSSVFLIEQGSPIENSAESYRQSDIV